MHIYDDIQHFVDVSAISARLWLWLDVGADQQQLLRRKFAKVSAIVSAYTASS
jgi:hypothetical protein